MNCWSIQHCISQVRIFAVVRVALESSAETRSESDSWSDHVSPQLMILIHALSFSISFSHSGVAVQHYSISICSTSVFCVMKFLLIDAFLACKVANKLRQTEHV